MGATNSGSGEAVATFCVNYQKRVPSKTRALYTPLKNESAINLFQRVGSREPQVYRTRIMTSIVAVVVTIVILLERNTVVLLQQGITLAGSTPVEGALVKRLKRVCCRLLGVFPPVSRASVPVKTKCDQCRSRCLCSRAASLPRDRGLQ